MSIAAAYDAAPTAAAPADTGANAFAAAPALLFTVSSAFAAASILLTFSAVSSAASATPSSSLLLSCACCSKSPSLISVDAISLCSARYCSSLTSPFSNCSCTCFSASFSVSNFSFVLPIASFRIFCFCAKSSVFEGSSFNNLSTSLNSFCKELHELFTPESALDNLVVSPPISMVIPLIFPAAMLPLSFPHLFPQFLPIRLCLFHSPAII